jgi:hypothetical protein
VNEAEVLARALEIARGIAERSIEPIAGAAAIWVLSSENDRACFDELRAFIAAASQWDEVPMERAGLIQNARLAADDLLALHPEA